MRFRASNTMTLIPRSERMRAAANPAIPAPIITTSLFVLILLSSIFLIIFQISRVVGCLYQAVSQSRYSLASHSFIKDAVRDPRLPDLQKYPVQSTKKICKRKVTEVYLTQISTTQVKPLTFSILLIFPVH